MGELHPDDLAACPPGPGAPPSEDFLAQLRLYTGWRQPLLAELQGVGAVPRPAGGSAATFKSF